MAEQDDFSPKKPFFLTLSLEGKLDSLSQRLSETKGGLSKFSLNRIIPKSKPSAPAASKPPERESHPGPVNWNEDGQVVPVTAEQLLEESASYAHNTSEAADVAAQIELGGAREEKVFPQSDPIKRDEGPKKLKAPRPKKPTRAPKKNERMLKNTL